MGTVFQLTLKLAVLHLLLLLVHWVRGGLYDAASIRVHPTGKITVHVGAHSHGQGHETTFSQIVADSFGIE